MLSTSFQGFCMITCFLQSSVCRAFWQCSQFLFFCGPYLNLVTFFHMLNNPNKVKALFLLVYFRQTTWISSHLYLLLYILMMHLCCACSHIYIVTAIAFVISKVQEMDFVFILTQYYLRSDLSSLGVHSIGLVPASLQILFWEEHLNWSRWKLLLMIQRITRHVLYIWSVLWLVVFMIFCSYCYKPVTSLQQPQL